MRKTALVSVIVLLLLAFSLALVGCTTPETEDPVTETEEPVYEITGTKNIILKADVTQYDFLSGIGGKKDGEAHSVEVDSSAVVFGVAGIYEVVYTCGEESETITVKIYGMPVFSGDAQVSRAYAADIDAGAGLTAKDSFGEDLTVVTTDEFVRDTYSRITYAEHEFVFKATDAAGNEQNFTRKVTVTETGRPAISGASADLSAPEASVPLGTLTLDWIKKSGTALDTADYGVSGGNLVLRAGYVAELGVGEHEFELDFGDAGYCDLTLDVTDTEMPAFTVGALGAALYVENTSINLPVAQRQTGSYQNIEVKYYLDSTEITELTVTLDAGEYEYAVKFFRLGAEIQNADETIRFTVMTEAAYYGRPFAGAEFASLFVPIDATRNSVEWDESQSVFRFINTVQVEDNNRGFTVDASYFSGIVEKSGAEQIKFSFKNETPSAQLFLGWWRDSEGWSVLHNTSAADWVEYTINMAAVPAEKTLFLLATSGGFFLKDIQLVMPVQYNEVKSFVFKPQAEGGGVYTSALDIEGLPGYEPEDWRVNYTSYVVPGNVQFRSVPTYYGIGFTLPETVTCTDDMILSFRINVDSMAEPADTVRLRLFNNTDSGLWDAPQRFHEVVSIPVGNWYEVRVNIANYLAAGGSFTGFKWVSFTGKKDSSSNDIVLSFSQVRILQVAA
ncbi:MAG: hypothetical protein LBH24_03800 [Clostridiales bacterium]|nr:hypothetical protein [Clostridiales bacterium]